MNYNKPMEIINGQLQELAGIYRFAASEVGISDNELMVWEVLLVMGEKFSQQDLSSLLSLSKQTINSIVSNLVKKGYVYLETLAGTRNRKLIHLTEAGKTYCNSKIAWIFNAEKSALSRMSDDEMQQCISILNKYSSFLKEELDKSKPD